MREREGDAAPGIRRRRTRHDAEGVFDLHEEDPRAIKRRRITVLKIRRTNW